MSSSWPCNTLQARVTLTATTCTWWSVSTESTVTSAREGGSVSTDSTDHSSSVQGSIWHRSARFPRHGFRCFGGEVGSLHVTDTEAETKYAGFDPQGEWMNDWKCIYRAQNLACSERQIHTVHTCKLSQAKTYRRALIPVKCKYTQWIQVSSRKLKPTEGHSYQWSANTHSEYR